MILLVITKFILIFFFEASISELLGFTDDAEISKNHKFNVLAVDLIKQRKEVKEACNFASLVPLNLEVICFINDKFGVKTLKQLLNDRQTRIYRVRNFNEVIKSSFGYTEIAAQFLKQHVQAKKLAQGIDLMIKNKDQIHKKYPEINKKPLKKR
jgi:hypothetical protein